MAYTGGNGGNGSSATPIEAIDQGAVDTTIALYNTLINSVPRLPKPPAPPIPNSTLYPYGCNIIQYNNTGTVQWTADISGTNLAGRNLTTDGQNVYAVGDFSGAILIVNSDNTQLTTSSPITTDANGSFIVKYNSKGIAQWAAYITSQNFLQLLTNVTDSVNSYQSGNCVINTNVYNASGTLYRTLKQSVNLFNASAITSDGTYIYIIDSNPTVYQFKTTGELIKQQNLSYSGMSTTISSVVWLAGYLYLVNRYIDQQQAIIWQLNTTFEEAPVIFVSNTTYPEINGSLSITTNYVSALYMVSITTPNVLTRAIVNNDDTPPSLTSVTFKGLNNISGLGQGIILPFGISYTNYDNLSDGHLLITDYNNGNYADISGIIWDVEGVNADGNWAPSGNLFLTVNTYTGTGRYINVPKSVNSIYADPASYNIYISLYGTNTFVKYLYQKPGAPNGPKIANLGNGTLLTNITKLSNTLYTLNYSATSILYSVTYPTLNRITSKQVYPLAANYNSGFVIKYSPSGAVSWISQFGANNANCTVSAMAIGPTGIYITGSYGVTGNFTFNNQNGESSGIVLTSASNTTTSSAFVAKYTTAGNAVWAGTIGNLNSTSGTAIYVDSSDNVYVAGTYNGTRKSGPLIIYPVKFSTYQTTATISLAGYNSGSAVYLAKYDISGVAQWATNIIAGTTNIVNAITANTTNIYLVGTATGNLTCNNTNATTFGPITTSVLGDGVLINYSIAGIAQWATLIFGGVPSYISQLRDYIYISGNMRNTLSLYDVPYDVSGAFVPPPSGQPIFSNISVPLTGALNSFLVAYNTNGTAIWGKNTCSPYLAQTATGGLTYGNNLEYVSVSIQPPSNTALYSYGINIIQYNNSGKTQWIADISGTNIKFLGLGTDGTDVYGIGFYYSQENVLGVPIFINATRTITVTTNITSGSNVTGIFLVKYNPAGVAQWTNNVENLVQQYSVGAPNNTQGIVSNGTSTYVIGSGQFGIIYNLDGTVFKEYTYPFINGCLIKYDASGEPVWVSSMAFDGGVCFPTQIVVSPSGIYVIGNFGTFGNFGFDGHSTVFFNDADDVNQLALNTYAYSSIFIVKYNTSGTPVWATQIQHDTSIIGTVYGTSIAVDSSDNVYIVGYYNNQGYPINVFSAGDPITLARQVYGSNAGLATILVKYNSNGIVQWATNIRSPDGDPINGNIQPYSLTVSGGFIYIVGGAYYADVATYDPTNATTNPAQGTQTQTGGTMIWNGGSSNAELGRNDGILVVYNTNGIPQWKTHIIGTAPYTSGIGVIATSVVTGGGNVYVSGFTDTQGPPPLVTFYNTPDGTVNSKIAITNTATINNFTVAYNTSGNVQWVNNTSAPGVPGNYVGPMAYTNVLYVSSPGTGVAT